MRLAGAIAVSPARSIGGRLHVPGDKSISHRYALLSALADGQSRITNYAPGADCHSTLDCINLLGATVTQTPVTADEAPPHGDHRRSRCRRTAAAVAAPRLWKFGQHDAHAERHCRGTFVSLDADWRRVALQAVPMRRIIAPLRSMGAVIDAGDGDRPPLDDSWIGAAQHRLRTRRAERAGEVGRLLAALHADGESRVTEPATTRDHTERALAAYGVELAREGRALVLRGGQRLRPLTLRVPGDLSSAAFLAVAAAALPGSDLTIEGVGLNPTRTLARRDSSTGRRRYRNACRRRVARRAGRSHSHSPSIARPRRHRPGRGPGTHRRAARAGGARHLWWQRVGLRCPGAARQGKRPHRRAGRRAARHGRRCRRTSGRLHHSRDRAGCRRDRRRRMAIIGWPWPLPSRRLAPPMSRPSKAPTWWQCRIRASSTISDESWCEDRQGLSRRLHGSRQKHDRTCPGPPARLAGRGYRLAHRARRAPRHSDDFSPGRRAIFPCKRARRS